MMWFALKVAVHLCGGLRLRKVTALAVSLSHRPTLGAAGNGQKPAIKPRELKISFSVLPGHVAVAHPRQKCSPLLYQLVCRGDVCLQASTPSGVLWHLPSAIVGFKGA